MTHSAALKLDHRKQTIARHFANASHYDEHATIQQKICHDLLATIPKKTQDSVLEIGAGTGQMTRLLAEHIQSQHWLINELCAEQTATLQGILPNAQIAIGDAETIDFKGEHSLIVSANAVQWFDNPLSFVTQSASRLQAGGQLAFSTFTPNNFLQIKALTGQGLHYPDMQQWRLALHYAGFDNIALSTRRFDVTFSSPYAVLKHMKLTGVSTNQTQNKASPRVAFIWNKSSLQQFERRYWQQFSAIDEAGDAGVILTYEALIISAQLIGSNIDR
ncbi:methyltransferase domain-containing protein [Psychrobacter celer]|uniref:methyltransferase domain-containing protein n=1 Tax=Psychrobacter celer TaxID=306572 RepID=UPI003FCF8245